MHVQRRTTQQHLPPTAARLVLQEWERWVQQGGKPHQHPAVAQMTAAAGAAGGRGAGGAAGIQLSLAELAKNDYMADL